MDGVAVNKFLRWDRFVVAASIYKGSTGEIIKVKMIYEETSLFIISKLQIPSEYMYTYNVRSSIKCLLLYWK